jgi:hypothetical protein
MADRQLINKSAPIPRGRVSAPLNLRAAEVPNAWRTSTFSNPTPTAAFGKGGLQIQAGADVLSTARSMGMETAPVAMSMASARKAHAAGLLGSGESVTNMSRKAERGLTGGITIVVDLTDLMNLSRRFAMIGVGIERGHAAIAKAINDGGRKLQTGLKRKVQQWTGIKQQARIVKAFRWTPATAATMTGMLTIADRHTRITSESFGAAWSRANPGGTHSAWNRPQLAVGSFMIPGKKPLFKRVGSSKYPIAPLWGPNIAREVERHEAEVEADVASVARARVLATAERLLAMEIAKASR